jgi:hypothetical protein
MGLPYAVARARAFSVRAARSPHRDGGDEARERKGPKKMYYEVKSSTPPQRSYGTHKFPQNTHCGDTIELRNRYFVVDKVTVHYKLEYGKYRKDDTRLYVQEATRYLLNKHLEGLFKGSDAVKREKGEQNESADESDSLDPGEDDESKA